MLKLCRAVVLLACPALVGGCDANQLYLAYQTNIGINASVNPQMTEGHLMIGYDRDFVTLVPKSVPVEGTTNRRDAMSSMVCSELLASKVFLKKYTEYIATGPASRKFAEALVNKRAQPDDFFSCFKKEEKKTGQGGES